MPRTRRRGFKNIGFFAPSFGNYNDRVPETTVSSLPDSLLNRMQPLSGAHQLCSGAQAHAEFQLRRRRRPMLRNFSCGLSIAAIGARTSTGPTTTTTASATNNPGRPRLGRRRGGGGTAWGRGRWGTPRCWPAAAAAADEPDTRRAVQWGLLRWRRRRRRRWRQHQRWRPTGAGRRRRRRRRRFSSPRPVVARAQCPPSGFVVYRVPLARCRRRFQNIRFYRRPNFDLLFFSPRDTFTRVNYDVAEGSE